jgi:hypothetical protein
MHSACSLPGQVRQQDQHNHSPYLTIHCHNIQPINHQEEGGNCSPSRKPFAQRADVKLPPSSYDSATPGIFRPLLSASLPVDTQRPGGGRRFPLGLQTCTCPTGRAKAHAAFVTVCHNAGGNSELEVTLTLYLPVVQIYSGARNAQTCITLPTGPIGPPFGEYVDQHPVNPWRSVVGVRLLISVAG